MKLEPYQGVKLDFQSIGSVFALPVLLVTEVAFPLLCVLSQYVPG